MNSLSVFVLYRGFDDDFATFMTGPTFAGHLARQLNVSCDFSNENTTAGVRCDNYINVASGGSCSLAYPSTMMSMTSYCQSNGTFSPPFFPDQLDNAKKIASNYTADDLLLISIGGNDLNGLLNANDGFIDKIGDVLGSGHAVADTIMKGVRRLYDEGARNFALVNVPAVVLTPRALSSIGTSGVKFEGEVSFCEQLVWRIFSISRFSCRRVSRKLWPLLLFAGRESAQRTERRHDSFPESQRVRKQ